MKNIIKTSAILIMFAFTGTIIAHAEDCESHAYDDKGHKKNIVETAAAAGDFQLLLTAAEAAGLVETLEGEGPFTIFAPTDEAFSNLPEGMLEDLLKPENKEDLAALLTYHVVPVIVMAKDVKTGPAPTINGTELTIEVKDGKVTVDSGNVVATDIVCSNGVIHVVDSVLLPAADDAQQFSIR